MEYRELKANVNDGADEFVVSCVAFDAFEELAWVANQGGRVTSYYSIGLDKYTSFQTHIDEVRHITSLDGGILTVSGNAVRLTSRQGLQQFTLKESETMELKELQCAVKYENSSVLVGGHQHKLLQIDINNEKISKQVDTDEETVIMRQSPRLICCGDSMGKITLRDTRTLQAEHVFQAHSDALSDFDICGNVLVSCGFSSRYGQLSGDRHLLAFDVRAMKAMAPVMVPIEPTFLRFVPAFTSRLAAVSQTGQLVLCDPSAGAQAASSMSLLPVLAEGLFCYAMDISSTGQALLIADSTGIVHLWSSNDQPLFNSYSNQTIFPDPIMPLPYIDFDDLSVPLSVVPMPVSSHSLLSDWPEANSQMIRRPSPKIDPEVLQAMKVVDGIGRAPNPGKRRRNEIPYEMKPLEDKSDNETGLEEVPCLSTEMNSDLTGIPKRYHRVDMMGIEGVDFSQDKPSIFAGLRRHNNPNTYCNALLQVLYFVEPLHCVMESHVCPKESCLSCELGFLFSALDLTPQKSCETSSLIRVFQNLPEATALGLVLSEKDAGKANLARLSQSWSRFILQQISKDIENDDQQHPRTEEATPGSAELSVIEKIFSMEIDTETRCRCGKKSNRSLTAMQLSLNYPRGRNGDLLQLNDEVSFVHLLENSMQKEQTTQAWCDQCSKYKTHSQTREVRRLPDVMLISCLDDVRDYEFWKSQQKLLDNRESPSTNWLPVSITAILTSKGELTIQKHTETEEFDSSQNSADSAVICYDLMGVVSYVEGQMIPGHLIAHILPNNKYYKRKQVEAAKQWWLFNDQIVCESEQDELLRFSNWRVPCHLCYTRRDLNDQYNLTVQPVTDRRLLQTPPVNKANARPATSTFKPLQADEILTDKAVVAVGAEFVALHLEQNERSIGKATRRCPARVTVIRGEGALEGVPFIDDYIAQAEQSVEFLAQYCGVKHGDLEPAISNKHLTSLKTACLKLRYLRDTGVKFVGYGLINDLHLFNFYASEECLLDIAQLFCLPGERSVPLRFMAWYFLGMHVQTSGRNSIEDAQTALKLYRKYKELKDDPSVDFIAAVQRLYRAGRQHDWNVPA